MKKEKIVVTSTPENYFLKALPLIHQIVSRKLNFFYVDFVEDIEQKVILSLWKWKLSHSDKKLSDEDWLKLTNTSTRNEIKRFFSNRSRQPMSLTEVTERSLFDNPPETLQTPPPFGNTKTEVSSLVRKMWKILQKQSLFEKAVFLLKDRKIINYLVLCKCCGIEEIAETLEMTTDEFKRLYKTLPFSDENLRLWLAKKLNREFKANQIHKARHRIRAKFKNI